MADSRIEQLARTVFYQEHKLVMLAGAGLSMAVPTEFDNARQLAERIVREISGEFNDLVGRNYSDLGELYDDLVTAHGTHGKERFIQAVQQMGPSNYPPNKGHKSTIRLFLEGAIHSVYSLNVDPLLEKCADEITLPSGWDDARDIKGNSLSVRWGRERVEGIGQQQNLMKIHGCIRRDPIETIWSAAAMRNVDWPTSASWAKTSFETDLQHHELLIIGCGSPVSYINQSIRSGRNDAATRQLCCLVSTESFRAYSTERNPELIECTEVCEDHFFARDAAEFLEELHQALCREALEQHELDLQRKIDHIANTSAIPESILVTENARLKERVSQVVTCLKNDTELVQRLLRRSLLWSKDVREGGIAQYYIPVRPNREIVADIVECISMLSAVLEGAELDVEQAISTVRVRNGRSLLVIHCRRFPASQVYSRVVRVLGTLGPITPKNLILFLLHAQATGIQIRKVAPLNRTMATAPNLHTRVFGDIPADCTLVTSRETLDRAPFEASEPWKESLRRQVQ